MCQFLNYVRIFITGISSQGSLLHLPYRGFFLPGLFIQMISCTGISARFIDITTLNEAQGRLLSFTHVFSTYTPTELTNTSP